MSYEERNVQDLIALSEEVCKRTYYHFILSARWKELEWMVKRESDLCDFLA